MNIFKEIKKSVYGSDLYNNLRSEKTGSSIKYYFKFILLISIIPTVIWTFSTIPTLKDLLSSENISKFTTFYPADLNLKIKDGQFSTNVVEPYYIPIPEKYKENNLNNNKRKIDNLVVINTKVENFSPDILEQNKTIAFITKNSIITEKDSGLQVVPLNNYKEVTYELNRQSINDLISKIVPKVKPLIYLVPLFVFIGYFIGFVFSLISLLILALIIWLVLIIKKKSIGYKYSFRVTLHAITLSFILNIFYSAIYKNSISWLILSIITIIIVIINIKKDKNNTIAPIEIIAK